MRAATGGGTLRVAAVLLVLYGFVVLIGALLISPEVASLRGLARAVVRFGGMLLIGWGLWRRESWAWWLGVIVSGLLSVLALLADSVVSAAGQSMSSLVGPAFWLSLVLLVVSFVVLVLPSSRSALTK